MAGIKQDGEARRHWGGAYDAIPKSAFALVSYHLAMLAAEDGSLEALNRRFVEEAEALAANGIMPAAHADTIRKFLGGAA